MIKFRPNLEFRNSFPDDTIEEEGEDGDIIQFPGLNITEVIAAMLKARGYMVSAPRNMDELGWELDILLGGGTGRNFGLRINPFSSEEGYLHATGSVWQIFGPDRHFATFLSHLDAALRSDERFDLVGWFPENDDGQRTPSPAAKDGASGKP